MCLTFSEGSENILCTEVDAQPYTEGPAFLLSLPWATLLRAFPLSHPLRHHFHPALSGLAPHLPRACPAPTPRLPPLAFSSVLSPCPPPSVSLSPSQAPIRLPCPSSFPFPQQASEAVATETSPAEALLCFLDASNDDDDADTVEF